jgi:transposase
MAKYKAYSYSQGVFIPVHFDAQIQEGTFEFALNYIVDNELNLSVFNDRYNNDDTGAPAYDPKILLKIVIFAYSRGIITSRKIEQACRENVVFMALSANTKPHFTTIASFVSSIDKEVVYLFRDVLMYCDEMGLIGKEMFAIDGCKIPSNASKELSGTMADYEKKIAKMEKAIECFVDHHQRSDQTDSGERKKDKGHRFLDKLRKKIEKIRNFTDKNDDKLGKTGKPRKSNITDNDSAKMSSSRGILQGYSGVAAVDNKYQIIANAEAFGNGSEQDTLEPIIEGTRRNFSAEDLASSKWTADSGFHNETNMKMLAEKGLDGYVADNQMRQRDPLFKDRGRYKERHRKERAAFEGRSGLFKVDDFFFPEDLSYAICPAGKKLYRSGSNIDDGKFLSHRFKGTKTACAPCHLRNQCLRKPEKTEIRQVAYFHGRSAKGKDTFTERMRHKIDSAVGRFIYSQRMGTVEPVFANICSTLGMNRFTLRGKAKVNGQWLMYCMVHNLKKIHRYAPCFT